MSIKMKLFGRRTLLVSVSALAIFVALGYRLLFPGISFLVSYMDDNNRAGLYSIKDVSIKVNKDRTIPARLYTPDSEHSRTIVLIHGVHSDGYNEKRLIHLAYVLVQMGYQVFIPDIADLRSYDIVLRASDDIESAALWMLESQDLKSADKKVGLWGISFAGGLCMRLSSSDSLKDRISSVFSFGGHGNMNTTIDYLMTGETPTGTTLPHIYGQAVLLRRYADVMVPKDQVLLLQDTMLDYLRGDHEKAKVESEALPKESRRYTHLIFERDVKTLGRLLKEKIGTPSTPKAVSADTAPPPQCSVHLLHGSLDNVIPPSELTRLEEWASHGDIEVFSLVSDMINHVELEDDRGIIALIDYYKIIRFWTELLRNS